MAVDILEMLKQRHSGEQAKLSLLDSLARGSDVEPLPPPKKSLIGETIKEFEALPLTAAEVATGLAGDIAGGWAGMLTGTGVDIANFLAPELTKGHPFFEQGGMLAAEDVMKTVKGAIPSGTWPYAPEGELAERSQRQQEMIAKPFEIIRESSDWWGKRIAETSGRPELGAAVAVAIESATIFAGPKLAKSGLKIAEPAFRVSRESALRLKRKINRATRTGDYSDPGLIKAAENILTEARKDPAMMAEVERYMSERGTPVQPPPKGDMTPPPVEPTPLPPKPSGGYPGSMAGQVEPLNTVGGDFATMQELGHEWGGRTRSPQKLYDAGYSVEEVSRMTQLERARIYKDLETKLSPREYQEAFPEKTVHLDWDKANSPRFVFEGAGDILRELQKSTPDPGYIGEKLKRIKRYFDEKHPDDTIEAARKYEPEKLAKLTEEYKNQPVSSDLQQTAKDAIIALLEGKNSKARRLYSRIEATVIAPEQYEVTIEPSKLDSYATAVKAQGVKSVRLVGSSTRTKGADIDILYDFGKKDIPEIAAEEYVTSLIENTPGINLDIYDTFIKVNDRYFHVSKGAGREVIENTEYGTKQVGRPFKELGRPPIKYTTPEITPQSQAAKHGISYAGTEIRANEPLSHRYYDPQTGEYFRADTPESVGQELKAHRENVAARVEKYKGADLNSFARRAKDWKDNGVGDIQQIKQEALDYIAEKDNIGFETKGHEMEFEERANDLLQIINKAMKEKGVPITQAEIEKPLVKSAESAKMSPREYQEMFPEKTVHLDWGRANSPRFIFEGAGDILRELQKSSSDPGYISEKLNRIKRYFNELHPDDTIEAARKYAPDNLAKLTEEYKNQPVESAAELTAKKAIIALLEGKNILAKRLYSKIESNLGDIEAFKNIGKVERPPTIKAKLSDSNISNPKTLTKEQRLEMIKKSAEKRSRLRQDQLENIAEEGEWDFGREVLPDEAIDVWDEMAERHTRALESSEPRDLVDIFNDAKTLFEGEEGLSPRIFGEPSRLTGLTHDQRMALQRLVADAKRMVGDLSDYLREIGLNEKQIAFVRTQIDQMRKVEPETFGEVRQHWIDARAIAAGDKIIKQRKPGKGRQASPVYFSEAKMIQELPNLEKNVNMKVGMSNPMRVLERLDPEGIGIREVYYDYRQAEQLYRRESKQVKQEIKDLRKGVSWKSRKRIGAYAVGQQERGLNILHRMGIKVPELSATEMRVYENLRGRYEQLFERIQTMRQMIGREPLEKVDNYFTFFRTFGILEKAGITFNPLLDKASIVSKTYNSYGSTPFKFGIERVKKGTMPVELDPFKVFENYSDVALRHLHLSPWVAKMNELMGVLPDLKTGKYNWLLRQKAPNTYNFLRNWVDHIAGKPPELSFGTRWDRVFMRLNKNLAFAILAANVRSTGIQTLALVNTVGEIGYKYAAKGVGATLEDVLILSGKNRKFALKHSKVLDGRTYDITIEDAVRGIRGGQIGVVQDFLGRSFLKPLQITDMETAIATWNGAFKLATDNGMKFERAVNFADDVVTRTQASALPGDLAPIQWSAFGKSVTLFQTFVINNWGFLTKDVLGLGNVSISNDVALRKVIRLVSAMTAANILLEGWGEWGGLGLQSPFPTPIKDIQRSIENNDPAVTTALKVAFGLIDPVPVIGSARYGKGPGGPVLELGYETVRSLQGAPMAKPLPEIAGKILGVPGTTQIGKSLRAKERGESTYGIVVGRYRPEDYAKRKRKNPLGGLKGLEGLNGL